jgi:hypothetical protein
MAPRVDRADAKNLSINQLASELGLDRATLTKRIDAAGVKPAGMKRGFPVYRLKDVLRAVRQGDAGSTSGMSPSEERAHYDAQLKRIEFEERCGKLIPAADYEQGVAELVKVVVQTLDTLPDILERDVGLTPAQVVRAQQEIDRLRQRMFDAVAGDARAAG